MLTQVLSLFFIASVTTPVRPATAQPAEADNPGPFVGTWVLNLEKSSYEGARRKKVSTRTLDVYGDRLVATHRRVIETSGEGFSYWVGNLSGEPFPEFARQRGNRPGNMVSITRVSAHVWNVTFTNQEGRVVLTDTWTVSPDGETLTINRKGTPRRGQPRNSIEVYENDGFARPPGRR